MDYNNALLIGLPQYQIRSLQFVINCAVFFIYNVKNREHITPYRYIIKAHIFKVFLLVFNRLYCFAPKYLKELLVWNVPTCKYAVLQNVAENYKPTRTQDPYLLVIPTNFGNQTRYRSTGRSFSHYASRCWNQLPFKIRSCENNPLV